MKNQNIAQTNSEFDPNHEMEFIIREAKQTATFLSSFALGFACLNSPFDLSDDDWQGISAILRTQSEKLERAEEIYDAYTDAIRKPLSKTE
ncbi:MAG: hypothetical protein WDZ54_00550 [Sneathiella sp.]